MAQISLSLVSHTNAGKTTLARTLLGREVGEVRDAPHVTEFADAFPMIAAPRADTGEIETLWLWDTPGLGDSLRLAKRLRATNRPLAWFLSQVWDRWRDRPFWASQQALKNVRDEADLMLYLVNAAESPEAAGYVTPEMEILAWVGKPVVVLLNQLGPPRPAPEEAAELQRWRDHLALQAHVKAVLPLDAFARCWVQEFALLHAVEAALGGELAARMARLRVAWGARSWATFDASVAVIATRVAEIAFAFEALPEGGGVKAGLRRLGAALGVGAREHGAAALARRALGRRLDADLRSATSELIALHGLEGRAEDEILARIEAHYELRSRLDEGKAALWGGAVTGALAGLKADLLSGGLTLGGGLLAGGLIGALGGAGVARGVNRVRGTDRSGVGWSAEALDRVLESALLRYLAVAHFGRGRGEWAQGESPPHWQAVVDAALAPERGVLAALWSGRERRVPEAPAIERLAGALEPVVRRALLRALQRLYPEVAELHDPARVRENAPVGTHAGQ